MQNLRSAFRTGNCTECGLRLTQVVDYTGLNIVPTLQSTRQICVNCYNALVVNGTPPFTTWQTLGIDIICPQCFRDDVYKSVPIGSLGLGTSSPYSLLCDCQQCSAKFRVDPAAPKAQTNLCKTCLAPLPLNGTCLSCSQQYSYKTSSGPYKMQWQQPPKESSVQTTAKLWWDNDSQTYAVLLSGYNKPFVDFIKAQIPWDKRTFDEKSKIWYFAESFLPVMELWTKKTFGQNNVTIVTRAQTPPPKDQGSRNDERAASSASKNSPLGIVCEEFIALIPKEVMKQAFRDTIFQIHPDRGGDPEKASRFNMLWDRIQREIYK